MGPVYSPPTAAVPAPAPVFASNISLSLSSSENSDTIDMRDELIGIPSGATINWSESESDADFSARINSSGTLTVTRVGTTAGSGVVNVTASYTINGVTGPATSVNVSVTIAALPQVSASLNNYMPRVGDILVCTVTGGFWGY